MKTLTTLLVAALLCGLAQARLGETTEEIQKRYGPARPAFDRTDLATGLVQSNYTFKNFTVTVVFKEGKSVKEILDLNEYGAFTDSACLSLIATVAGVTNIQKDVDDENRWSGQGIFAKRELRTLTIENKLYQDAISEAARRRQEDQKKADAKIADGF